MDLRFAQASSTPDASADAAKATTASRFQKAISVHRKNQEARIVKGETEKTSGLEWHDEGGRIGEKIESRRLQRQVRFSMRKSDDRKVQCR